ncbi:MAG: hypothetical protein HZB24_09780 [Desulfobacterales bacterium]|nr:hypothetical protein [Desulfobacterales bacterium]
MATRSRKKKRGARGAPSSATAPGLAAPKMERVHFHAIADDEQNFEERSFESVEQALTG